MDIAITRWCKALCASQSSHASLSSVAMKASVCWEHVCNSAQNLLTPLFWVLAFSVSVTRHCFPRSIVTFISYLICLCVCPVFPICFAQTIEAAFRRKLVSTIRSDEGLIALAPPTYTDIEQPATPLSDFTIQVVTKLLPPNAIILLQFSANSLFDGYPAQYRVFRYGELMVHQYTDSSDGAFNSTCFADTITSVKADLDPQGGVYCLRCTGAHDAQHYDPLLIEPEENGYVLWDSFPIETMLRCVLFSIASYDLLRFCVLLCVWHSVFWRCLFCGL